MIKQYDEDILIPQLDKSIEPEIIEEEPKVEVREELIMHYTDDNKVEFIKKCEEVK